MSAFKKFGLSMVLILFLGQGSLASEVQTVCSSYLESCEYYQCRDQLQMCGPQGYFLRFGYPYCSRFMTQVKPTFSEEGALWLDRVGQCLRDQLEGISVQESCKETEDLAISSHVSCYLDTGFCQLSFSEKLKLLKVVYKELQDSRLLGVFLKLMTSCQ